MFSSDLMKKLFFLILIFILSTIFIIIVKAQEELEAPPGMEIIKIGDVRYIVPQGTKMRKQGGIVTLEGHNEYMARRFSDVEERLKVVEREIEELRSIVLRMQKGQSN